MTRNELAEILRPDGSEVFISSSSAPVYDPRGTIVASVALSIDVTETIRTQKRKGQIARWNGRVFKEVGALERRTATVRLRRIARSAGA